jgi:hypothetical protein
MKSTTFQDITPCSLFKQNRCFKETYSLRFQGRRISSARNRVKAGGWFLARLILRSWRRKCYISPKRRLAFNRLYGVISQKRVLFINAAVRTSSPTYLLNELTKRTDKASYSLKQSTEVFCQYRIQFLKLRIWSAYENLCYKNLGLILSYSEILCLIPLLLPWFY